MKTQGQQYLLNCGKANITYRLHRSNRKSLEIAVHPDKRIVVRAPERLSVGMIEDKVCKRARWIKKQIDYFNQFEPRTPARQYVGGESHRYLGRQYRLKIEDAADESVRLKRGYFYIACRDQTPAHVKALLDAWYRRRADIVLPGIFDAAWADFSKGADNKPALRLRTMKTRWGSYSPRGKVTLNRELIRAPKDCIEYVAMHELCHSIHRNHGAGFYRLMAQVIPDWKRRKRSLELCFV